MATAVRDRTLLLLPSTAAILLYVRFILLTSVVMFTSEGTKDGLRALMLLSSVSVQRTCMQPHGSHRAAVINKATTV
jgi:hypothetical protein